MAENEKEVEVINNTNTLEEKKGKSIASMVLGIVSVIGLCFGYGGIWIPVICAILALIFGILGKKDENAKGMAKTGIILSIITLAFLVILILALIVLFALGVSAGILSSI